MADLLTAKQIQKLLHVDRSTVYRMADTGRLPAIKVGRQWRFPSNEIANWLEEQGAVVAADNIAPPESALPLSDDLPVSCVQVVQDTFADLLGVMMLVTDMEGQPITAVSNPCGLYSATLPNSQRKCRDQWQKLANTLDLRPKFVPSQIGLLGMRGLIRDGNRLRGVVIVDGIAPTDWPPSAEQVQLIAQTLDLPVSQIEAHVGEVFYLTDAQKAQVAATVQRIADIVSHILNERKRMANY